MRNAANNAPWPQAPPGALAADAAAAGSLGDVLGQPTLRTALVIGGLGGFSIFVASWLNQVRQGCSQQCRRSHCCAAAAAGVVC